MVDENVTDAQQPLAPRYPFNQPGVPITLYEGQIGGLPGTDVQGRIELSCAPRPSIDWTVHADHWAGPFANLRQADLLLHMPYGDAQLPAAPRGPDGGWSNGTALGNPNAELTRLTGHWFNLPNLYAPIRLTTSTPDGGQRWWTGRWVISPGGWVITFDVRPDHGDIWTDLHKRDVYVMTHVMEVRREDKASFTVSEAQTVISALHVGVSFALGCWVAPMLPVGEDINGAPAWEEWRAYHCDPARNTNPGWWYTLDRSSLAELLNLVIPEFEDPERMQSIRMQMMLAIEATNDRGFVEQRVMTAVSGLEHVLWQALVGRGQLTETQYVGTDRYEGVRLNAHHLLRMALKAARISTDLDASLMPACASFVAAERHRQGRDLDGADVVTQVRNRLVHPKGSQNSVYKYDGLVPDVWRLARHYLVLLILHQLGYRGTYRDLRMTEGWVGDVGRVPWS